MEVCLKSEDKVKTGFDGKRVMVLESISCLTMEGTQSLFPGECTQPTEHAGQPPVTALHAV